MHDRHCSLRRLGASNSAQHLCVRDSHVIALAPGRSCVTILLHNLADLVFCNSSREIPLYSPCNSLQPVVSSCETKRYVIYKTQSERIILLKGEFTISKI